MKINVLEFGWFNWTKGYLSCNENNLMKRVEISVILVV